MTNFTRDHLKTVTVENLQDFRANKLAELTTYASCNGVKLRFDSYGNYRVETKTSAFMYTHSINAVNKYKELVNNQ